MEQPDRPPMIVEEGVVVANRPAGTADCYLLSVRSPRIAAGVQAGQFVMVRLPHRDFPYLGRPLSVADVDPGEPDVFVLAHVVVGEGTRLLAEACPGDTVRSLGPLGNRFTIERGTEHVFIAGGIGAAPFPFLAREIARVDPGARRTCLLGAADRTGLHLAAELRSLGVEVATATMDGSEGYRGTVVDLLATRELRPDTRLYACGPNPMFAALARHLAPTGHPCQAAVEGHMACGFGACNACVIPVQEPGDTDRRYGLICLEGPVFELGRIRWDAAGRESVGSEVTHSP
jgi:dihydroorotate dehydrogenase electron transfer subunit